MPGTDDGAEKESVVELSAYTFSVLRKDEFTLHRGRGDFLEPILMVSPGSDDPAASGAKRLEHEYALRHELNSDWALRPLGLGFHEHRVVLILPDPGYEPLDLLFSEALAAPQFLRIAIALAAACRQMHESGIIHKDIKPSNVLVAPELDHVRLTGFGIASRLPRQRLGLMPPEFIAGTLAYMAPEQTGRMNRSIDARSDLYALGVTLYELLTGSRPFSATDAMELVHCHIARTPPMPKDRVASIPDQLAAIVLKLLAKTAEDRYQTAAGVEAELRLCLTSWEAKGRIDEFPPGAYDVPDRLRIPEKLYGREAEVDVLVNAFNRVVARGNPELVLVSGYSGIGKSSVVNELHKVLAAPRGLFAAGKFEQYKRDIPYGTLAQAFQALVRRLLGSSDEELDKWRRALREALGPNGQLMVSLIPELSLILGEQPPVPELPPQDRQNRFQLVFRRFLAVFAKPEHPLALFLDDLQWLDAATLDMLRHLITHDEVQHVLFIGAYRANDVVTSHPLSRMLEEMRGTGAPVHRIELTNLGLDNVVQLLAEALHCEQERALSFAQLVHQKTGGNPFATIQFIEALADADLIAFDRDARAWHWDMQRIEAANITENVADLMAAKVTRLPAAAQRAMKSMAALGSSAPSATLRIILGLSEDEVHDALLPAVRAGLIFHGDNAYAFLHDRVQEVAYGMIPDDEQPAAHVTIGRLLLSHTPASELAANIFEIVDQLNRGVACITAQAERDKIAELNLIAGRRAKESNAYASALRYFAAGSALLVEHSPERRPKISFDLALQSAECEFLTGELQTAEQHLTILSKDAANLADRAAVTCLQMLLYTVLDRTDRAINAGCEFLHHVGIEWASFPAKATVTAEREALRGLLGGCQIEALIDLPVMTDPDSLAIMDVLAGLLNPALLNDHTLYHLVLLRMTNISLANGNCDASACAYVSLNVVLGRDAGDHGMALRFGQLGCDLVEKRGLDRFKARVYTWFGTFVLPWMMHLSHSRAPLKRAIETADATGDLSFAVYARRSFVTNLMTSGEPLGDVQREAELAFTFARRARFGLAIASFVEQLILIRELRGRSGDIPLFEAAGQDDRWFESHLEEGGPSLAVAASWYWIHKLQACFFSQNYQTAMAAAHKAESLLGSTRQFLEFVEYHFYAALTRAALCATASTEQLELHLEAINRHHRELAALADAAPENFEHRALLVFAEIARLECRDLDAQRLYEEAILSARTHRFVQNEGLANELAGRFHAAHGMETIANAYLRSAYSCYLRWGADAKLRQLEDDFPRLRGELAPTQPSTMEASTDRLDLATLIKMSQAISSEIDLKRLIEALLLIAMENAGADRGVLVIPQDGELRTEAEATATSETVSIRLLQGLAGPAEIPKSVVRYVARTHETFLLDDAHEQTQFPQEAYFIQRRCRSILCLPLIKQAELVGVLYLEHTQSSHVFTPARTYVLKLLASQAAISIENARLYTTLCETEAYLAEAQRLSRTGSFRWKPGAGKISWSNESFRIFGFEAGNAPTLEGIFERIHPDDRSRVQELLDERVQEGKAWEIDHRLLMPDGSIKYIQVVNRPVWDEAGELEYLGALIDVTSSRQSEDALRQAQAELSRVSRLTAMGELAGSIAHEINQPLAAVVTNAEAGLRWLNREEPNLEETQAALSRLLSEAQRVADVIKGLRALARKSNLELTEVDINDAINEVLALVQGELERGDVVLRLGLSDGLPPVLGDRIQLQQILLNLIRNGVDAMAAVDRHRRVIRISSKCAGHNEALVAVEDAGAGIDPSTYESIFEPLFTTKERGMGMGLPICRSIIEAHGGRLSFLPAHPHGAIFQFTVPFAKP